MTRVSTQKVVENILGNNSPVSSLKPNAIIGEVKAYPNMAFCLAVFFGTKVIVVDHGEENPTDQEWSKGGVNSYCPFCASSIGASKAPIELTFVHSNGGGPNALQRKEMEQVVYKVWFRKGITPTVTIYNAQSNAALRMIAVLLNATMMFRNDRRVKFTSDQGEALSHLGGNDFRDELFRVVNYLTQQRKKASTLSCLRT